MDNRLRNLGLCMRAGALCHGEEIVISEIQANKVCYIFLASNASDNAKKKITDKAKFYNVEVDESYSSEELSKAIGKENRMVLGITDKNFLKILKK